MSSACPALQMDSLPVELPRKPLTQLSLPYWYQLPTLLISLVAEWNSKCWKREDWTKSMEVLLENWSISEALTNNMDVVRRMGFSGGSDGKESACNEGDLGSVPVLGRSPREGNSNPLYYSCLENPMDGGPWQATVYGVAKSWTQLSNFIFHSSKKRCVLASIHKSKYLVIQTHSFAQLIDSLLHN